MAKILRVDDRLVVVRSKYNHSKYIFFDIARGAEKACVIDARRKSFANDHLLPVGRRRMASG